MTEPRVKSSRYATELFLEPPEEEFLCSICQDVLDGPIELPCRHTYCRICIKECKQTSECPLCRQNYDVDSDVKPASFAFQGLLMKLRMKCQNEACGKIVILEDYCNHQENCDFAPTDCPFKNCNKKILHSDLERHKEECAYREIPCPLGCGSTIQNKDVEDHFLLSCDQAFTECPFAHCPKNVCRKELERHKDVCEFRDVSCPHGCGEIIQHKDIEEHYSKSCPKGWRVCEKCERSYLYEERDDHDCIQVLKQEIQTLKENTKKEEAEAKKTDATNLEASKPQEVTVIPPRAPKSLRVRNFFKATTGEKIKADIKDLLYLPGGSILISDGNNGCLKLFDDKNAPILEKSYYAIKALNCDTLAAVCNDSTGVDILSLEGNLLLSIDTSEEVQRMYLSQDGSLGCTFDKGLLKINTFTGSEVMKATLPRTDSLVGVARTKDNCLILCDYKKKSLHLLTESGYHICVWTLPRRDHSAGLCYVTVLDNVIACCSNQRVYILEQVY